MTPHDMLGKPIVEGDMVIIALGNSSDPYRLIVGNVLRFTFKGSRVIIMHEYSTKPDYYKPGELIVMSDEDHILYKLIKETTE